MKSFWSILGMVFLILYVLVAISARVNDLNSSPIMMKDFLSTLVSLPGLLVLKLLGSDVQYPDSRQYLVGICITAIILYLLGALIEWCIRAIYRRSVRMS